VRPCGQQRGARQFAGSAGIAELGDHVRGRVVVVTGASSGIGRATAMCLARAGAHVALVARSFDPLSEVQAEISREGGFATVHAFDLSVSENCAAAIAEICAEHRRIDILINNAGRSIRRPVRESLDRFHDVERTIQLNYYGPVALILASLPIMLEQRSGHVVNVSSMGTQWTAPRFAAYVGSKSALESFSRSVASEVFRDNIAFSTVHVPLVRTPMIDASRPAIDRIPAWDPDRAAAMICGVVTSRRPRATTAIGWCGQLLQTLAPGLMQRLMAVTDRRANVFSSSGTGRRSTGYVRLIGELLGVTWSVRRSADRVSSNRG
jgi:short-subunit dehydrogenase